MSTLVLCPSRGRPGNAEQVVASLVETAVEPSTKILFLVDVDDPTRDDYPADRALILDPPPGSMNAALDRAAHDPAILDDATVVGFIGDDHRFRTRGWDRSIEAVLTQHPGICYGDDLYQRESLPTMWFLSRSIVNVFGMSLPALRHLWIDNYWKTLGEAADCLYYLPDIVIEHMHPYAGKGTMDDQYERVNSQAMISHDQAVFNEWARTSLASDAEKLRTIVCRAS